MTHTHEGRITAGVRSETTSTSSSYHRSGTGMVAKEWATHTAESKVWDRIDIYPVGADRGTSAPVASVEVESSDDTVDALAVAGWSVIEVIPGGEVAYRLVRR